MEDTVGGFHSLPSIKLNPLNSDLWPKLFTHRLTSTIMNRNKTDLRSASITTITYHVFLSRLSSAPIIRATELVSPLLALHDPLMCVYPAAFLPLSHPVTAQALGAEQWLYCSILVSHSPASRVEPQLGRAGSVRVQPGWKGLRKSGEERNETLMECLRNCQGWD